VVSKWEEPISGIEVEDISKRRAMENPTEYYKSMDR
jgi:hypothetical protein